MRIGFRFDPDPDAALPLQFSERVGGPGYEEYWSDELQVFHNPNAKHPCTKGSLPVSLSIFLRTETNTP